MTFLLEKVLLIMPHSLLNCKMEVNFPIEYVLTGSLYEIHFLQLGLISCLVITNLPAIVLAILVTSQKSSPLVLPIVLVDILMEN